MRRTAVTKSRSASRASIHNGGGSGTSPRFPSLVLNVAVAIALLGAILAVPTTAAAQPSVLGSSDPRCAPPSSPGIGTVRGADEVAEANNTFRATFLFVDHSDAPADQPIDAYRDAVIPSSEQILDRISYGQHDLDLNVHPDWIRMPQPSSAYGQGPGTPFDWVSFYTDAVAAADPIVDFSGSDAVYVMVPQNTTNHAGVNGADYTDADRRRDHDQPVDPLRPVSAHLARPGFCGRP